ncbi:MAG: hypothetical protein V1727_04520 [Candidatus Omnitrophota bacterium]
MKIIALGADIKNRILIGNGKKITFGPEIGDLSQAKNYALFRKTVETAIKKTRPDIIAYDLHPHYFSSLFAKGLSPSAKPPRKGTTYNLLPIQHHHAHIASVIHEHKITQPVIGVAFDGTGYGADGKSWGGEFLLVSKAGYERRGHFKYWKMPGGDKVTTEPWRMVLSILGERALAAMPEVKPQNWYLVAQMLAKNINSPESSSVGRLFDAVAALLGLCVYASYEAEGPRKLELLCDAGIGESYEFALIKEKGSLIVDTEPVFIEMLKDRQKKKNLRLIATKFHNTLTESVLSLARVMRKESGASVVALSGGVFQNSFLKNRLLGILAKAGFRVFSNEKEAANDLNIALGQYYVSGCSGKN